MKPRLFASLTGLAAVSLASMAFAQEDPVKARQALMKEIAGQMRVIGPMLQGKAPFDAEAARMAFEAIARDAAVFPTHFTEASAEGETGALPAIWENKADFDARAAKFAADAAAAAAATLAGEEAFKAAGATAVSNCGSCHGLYRKPS